MVKVSVCVTTYNHEPFIAQALDSVLMQETDFDYEIVLGEDESQDGTREICTEYAERYPDRIRLFLRSRKDVIYIDGRPTGRFNFVENLKAARGEYIALLDGDDYWIDPHKLQKQVDFLEEHPECSMCFHRHCGQHENGSNRPRVSRIPHRKNSFSMEDLLVGNFIGSASVMYRWGVVQELPGWYYTVVPADWPLHILHAQQGGIGFIDEVMSVYRIHGRGIWSGQSSIQHLSYHLDFYEKLRLHLGPGYDDLIDAGVSVTYAHEATFSANRGKTAEARRYLIQSVKKYPLNPHIRFLDRVVMFLRLYAPRLYQALKSIWTSLKPGWYPDRALHR